MHYGLLRRLSATRVLVRFLSRNRAAQVVSKLESFLVPGEHVLDLGCGSCGVAQLLVDRGYKVTLVDVKDQSFATGLRPLVYDGQHLPFEMDTFDVVILVDVLHHSICPVIVLNEARRVGRRLIVVEPVFERRYQHVLTLAMDMLVNLEFFDHARNHATDTHWRELFERLNLKLEEVRYDRFWKVFQEATYHLVATS